MTDKEIRRLGKTDLLKIIRDQEQELQSAKAQMDQLRAQLNDRSTQLKDCGSIAEASLKLNGVFAAAQAAANQYLAEVKTQRDGAAAEAERIVAEARRQAEAQLAAAAENAKKQEEQGQARAAAYWDALSGELDAFYRSHAGLQELLKSVGTEIRLPGTH